MRRLPRPQPPHRLSTIHTAATCAVGCAAPNFAPPPPYGSLWFVSPSAATPPLLRPTARRLSARSRRSTLHNVYSAQKDVMGMSKEDFEALVAEDHRLPEAKIWSLRS